MTPRARAAVLVTGGGGFIGRHLQTQLASHGHEVTITVRSGKDLPPGDAPRAIDLVLPDDEGLAAIITDAAPDTVVHLAAATSPPLAEAKPEVALRSNVEGTASVFRALDRVDPGRRIAVVMASTSHVYAPPTNDEPLTETSPLGPSGVYGRTKLAAELVALCSVAAASEGGVQTRPARPLVIFRSFNHAGPGQHQRFAISSFARQFARVKLGIQEPLIETGSVGIARDFTDVRDAARAYCMAVEGEIPPGVYNLASGHAIELRRILELFQEIAAVSVSFSERQERRRSIDVALLRGSAAKLERASGWRPAVPLDQIARDAFDWWINTEQQA